MFNGAEYDWVPHLDAVTAVLAMHSPEALLRTPSSPGNNSPFPASDGLDDEPHQSQLGFNFLVAEALWHDILACATTGRVPRMPYRQWLEGTGLEMANLMGCYNWVMVAIGDLAHLQAWKKEMRQQERLSVPELVRKGQRIERTLQDGITELKQIAKVSTNSFPRSGCHMANNSYFHRWETIFGAICSRRHGSRTFLQLRH